MGVAQILHGPLHLSKAYQTADVGGADGDAADRDLRDNVAAKTQLGALAFQQFRSALVLVAEAVVMTGHQMDGVIPLDENFRYEILPGGSHHLLVKGDHDDIVDAVETFGQPDPVLGELMRGTGTPVTTSFGGCAQVNTAERTPPGAWLPPRYGAARRRGPDGPRRKSPEQ